MRPASIVKFERVVLATVLIGLVAAAITWDASTAAFRRYGYGDGAFIAAQGFSLAVVLLLLWLIARRGSVIAKWIYVVLAAASAALAALAFGEILRQPPAVMIMEVVQLLLMVFSIWLLFRPDARGWFGRGGGAPAA